MIVNLRKWLKSGARGYDAGKKIKGRKRHIVADTICLIITADFHSASIQDRDGALDLFTQAKQKAPTLCKFFATNDTQVNYKTAVYWKRGVY